MEIGLVQGVASDEMIVKVVENGKEISIRFKRGAKASWIPWETLEFDKTESVGVFVEIDTEFFKN